MKRNGLRVVSLLATALTVSALGTLLGGCTQAKPQPLTIAEVPAQSFTKAWSVNILAPNSKSTLEWIYPVGGPLGSDYVLALTSDRSVRVIKHTTGQIVTSHSIASPGGILRPFTNGKLFCYPVSTKIEVFDLNGDAQRSINLREGALTTGTASESAIYIGVNGLNGARMRAIDPSEPYSPAKWEVLGFGPITSAPVFHKDLLFFATETGHVFAITEDGKSAWDLPPHNYLQVGPSVIADLTVDDYALYVPSTDSKLLALDRETGRRKWQYFASYPLLRPVVATSDTIYLTIRQEGLVAIDKLSEEFTKKTKWVNHEAIQFLSQDSKYAYVRLKNNAIGALDLKTGSIAFRSPASNFDYFITNTAPDGLIFAATKTGTVVAIKPIIAPGTVGELLFTATP